jgi:hypothetical protein
MLSCNAAAALPALLLQALQGLQLSANDSFVLQLTFGMVSSTVRIPVLPVLCLQCVN